MDFRLVISVVYVLDGLIALAAGLVIWRRREAAGAASLAYMLFAAAWWAFCDAIELYAPTVALKQFVSQVQYVGVIAAAPSYFEAAMVLAGERVRLTLPVRVAAWSVPLASLLFAWSNPLHHWLWTRITLPTGHLPFATYEYGWWFWVLTAQNYVLMAVASAVLLYGLRDVSRGFRAAMVVVVIATVLPWVGNAAYNLKLGPWPGLNWLTLSLGVSGWLLVWVVLRGGLLDLLPHAREALIEMMTDGVVVLDRSGRIVHSNTTARQVLALDVPVLLGIFGTSSLRDTPIEWHEQVPLDGEHGTRWLDVRVGPVTDRWGAVSGRLVVARDVTAQKQLERDRERLIEELREALRRVTQLEGLLPVCAGCRSVRDDADGWMSIEKYVAAHTPVEFTHVICPDCMERLYPEFSDPPGPSTPPHNGVWRPR